MSATHLSTAMNVIDDEFGAGYAVAHPELLGALVIAIAIGDVAQMVENNSLGLSDIFHAIHETAEAGTRKKRRTARRPAS